MKAISKIALLGILLLNTPLVYGATTAELQAQIAALLAQVQALQAQLQASSTTYLAKEILALNFNMRLGSTDASTNGEVTKLQQFLAQDKTIYPEALVTGYFGPKTEAAVKRFQSQNGISPVGIVGPQTREAIGRVTTPVTPPPTPPTTPPPTPTPAPTPAAAPSLGAITLSPSSGMVGDTVTITGSGFTATGNDIHFGIGGVKNIASINNGTMITFQVPSGVSRCDLVVAGAVICSDPKEPVAPGNYIVYVSNANGTTATTTFTVTSGTNYPAIISVSPDRGRTGETITITGTGLNLTDNEVHLGIGGVKVNTLRRVKGTLLNFTVPSIINDCDFSTGLPPCSGKYYSVGAGSYALYIVNPNGKTNSVTFTVTSY